jgi:ATP-dependent helicase/nuclease subunit A
VAVTRARDTLLLVGTARSRAAGQPWDCAPPDGPPLSRSAVAGARSHLDWLRLWLPRATAAADWRTDREGGNRLLRWRIAAQDDAVFAAEASDPDAMAAAGAGDSTADVAAVDALRGRLAWEYPQQSAGRLPAKTSVSALRRRLAEEPFAEALPMFEAAARRFPLKDDATGTPHLTATDIGTAHHLFLQLVSLDQTGGGAELRREAERLRAAGTLTAEQAAALDFEALTGFWQNPVGRRIRDCPAGTVHRELPFTARFRAGELTALGLLREAGAAEGEFIVVQGFADLVVTLERELWLVDFKTDRITAAEEAERARAHAPQVALYAAALDRIYGRPVTQRWLHFLALGRSVEV